MSKAETHNKNFDKIDDKDKFGDFINNHVSLWPILRNFSSQNSKKKAKNIIEPEDGELD